MGVKLYPYMAWKEFFSNEPDVVILAVSIISFDEVLASIPPDFLRGKLVADVLSVKMHAKETMLRYLPPEADILCTHPIFNPASGVVACAGLPFLYERVRITEPGRAARDFLCTWDCEGCEMIEMSCEAQDEFNVNSQFVTHLVGRVLGKQGLPQSPIKTQAYSSALEVLEMTCKDSFDSFYALYRFNPKSQEQFTRVRESFADIERQLAEMEARLAAKHEVAQESREEFLREVAGILEESITQAAFADLTAKQRAILSLEARLAGLESGRTKGEEARPAHSEDARDYAH